MSGPNRATGFGARTITLPAGVTNITTFQPISKVNGMVITNVSGVTAMILDSPNDAGASISPAAGLTLLASGNAYALTDNRSIFVCGSPKIFFCAGATSIINILMTENPVD